MRMRPVGTSHCHPIQSSVKPWFINAPLPNSAAVVGIGGSGRALEGRQDSLAAAVAGFVEQSAVAALRLDRLQEVEIRGDSTRPRAFRGASARSTTLVLRKIRIQLEVNAADDLFVRPGRPERLAAENRLATRDLEPHDVR